jgi:hypothetical protein
VLRDGVQRVQLLQEIMNGNLPTWAKIISQIGFPIVISLYLIVILYPLITETNAQVKEHIIFTQSRAAVMEEQVRLLRLICYNVAINDFQRSNCDSVR